MLDRNERKRTLLATAGVIVLFVVRFLVAARTPAPSIQFLRSYWWPSSNPKFQIFFIVSQALFGAAGLVWYFWGGHNYRYQKYRIVVYMLSLAAFGGLSLFLIEK
jgi:hypothetical protein